MQQKHVITHPGQAGRPHKVTPESKLPRKILLFSYELQLLCVWYYRSPPEIVYLKCYCEFFFFKLLIIYFTFYFIFVYFSNFRGSKNRGSMDPVHGGGPWTRGPCLVLSPCLLIHVYALLQLWIFELVKTVFFCKICFKFFFMLRWLFRQSQKTAWNMSSFGGYSDSGNLNFSLFVGTGVPSCLQKVAVSSKVFQKSLFQCFYY